MVRFEFDMRNLTGNHIFFEFYVKIMKFGYIFSQIRPWNIRWHGMLSLVAQLKLMYFAQFLHVGIARHNYPCLIEKNRMKIPRSMFFRISTRFILKPALMKSLGFIGNFDGCSRKSISNTGQLTLKSRCEHLFLIKHEVKARSTNWTAFLCKLTKFTACVEQGWAKS